MGHTTTHMPRAYVELEVRAREVKAGDVINGQYVQEAVYEQEMDGDYVTIHFEGQPLPVRFWAASWLYVDRWANPYQAPTPAERRTPPA